MAVFEAEYYTMAEVARHLNVSRSTIRRKIQSGEMPPMHPMLKRFDGAQLNQWLNAGQPWDTLNHSPALEHENE